MGRIEKALRKAAHRRSHAMPDELDSEIAEGTAEQSSDSLDFASLHRIELEAEKLKLNRVILTSDRSVAAESFKMLRTRVRHSMDTQRLKTLAVSSATPHDGKSLVAANLAFRMAADRDQQIVLVDLDLRHPSISPLLGLDPELPGLHECLVGESTLQETCVCPGPERLAILPNARIFENSSEILNSSEMSELVTELRGNGPARKVIFDLPPLLSADDLLAFSRHVDALLLVVCEGKTLRSDLGEVFEHLEDVNIIGTVLNRSVANNELYYD